MENLVFVFLIAALAFWLGRKTRPSLPPSTDIFATSAIHSPTHGPETDTARIPMNAARAFALIFTSGWIIAWSAGIFMAVLMFINSFGSGFVTVFMGGWLIAALAGWGLAANTIYRLATGRSVKSRGGSEY